VLVKWRMVFLVSHASGRGKTMHRGRSAARERRAFGPVAGPRRACETRSGSVVHDEIPGMRSVQQQPFEPRWWGDSAGPNQNTRGPAGPSSSGAVGQAGWLHERSRLEDWRATFGFTAIGSPAGQNRRLSCRPELFSVQAIRSSMRLTCGLELPFLRTCSKRRNSFHSGRGLSPLFLRVPGAEGESGWPAGWKSVASPKSRRSPPPCRTVVVVSAGRRFATGWRWLHGGGSGRKFAVWGGGGGA